MLLCLSVAVYANNDIKEYMWFCYSLIYFFYYTPKSQINFVSLLELLNTNRSLKL